MGMVDLVVFFRCGVLLVDVLGKKPCALPMPIFSVNNAGQGSISLSA